MSEIKSHSLIVLVCIAIMVALAIVNNADVIAEKQETEIQLKSEIEKRQQAEESLQELKAKIEKLEEENKRLLDRLESFLDEFSIAEFTVTAYAPLDSQAVEGMCYSGNPNITASGARVEPGKTVAAGPSLPFGTNLYIAGYGRRIVEDRGGAITDGRLDLAVQTREEALRFGRQEIKVIYEGVKR